MKAHRRWICRMSSSYIDCWKSDCRIALWWALAIARVWLNIMIIQ